MKEIIRLQTTEQAFDIDIAPDDIAAMRITYEQDGVTVIEKSKDDLVFSALQDDDCGFLYRAMFSFTQAETKMFNANSNVTVQLHVLTTSGQSLPSHQFDVEIYPILNDTILEVEE
jgi:hypothetical protein